MPGIQLDNLNHDNLYIDIINSDPFPTIRFSGAIDMEYPKKILDPYFNNLHETLLNNNIKKIILDFRLLQFLNSSGIKSFVTWIMRLQGLTPEQGYKIDFLLNDDASWQKESIKFLLFLAPDLLTIL